MNDIAFDGLVRTHMRAVRAYARAIGRDRAGRVVAAMAFAWMAGLAGPASAHLESSPSQVAPGALATVTFTVAHGCAGSPTTKVTMKLPITLKNVTVRPPKGWTGSIAGFVATFSGPPIPAKSPTSFKVSFTAPKTLGVLAFPSIQHCSNGENDWIELPLSNGSEPEHPAPMVKVAAPTTKSKSTAKQVAGLH